MATAAIAVATRRPAPWRGFQMPSVGVIGGTRTLCRHHRGAQRRLRRAFLAERGALVRLLLALQDQAADADR